jgi:hypothetical protein
MGILDKIKEALFGEKTIAASDQMVDKVWDTADKIKKESASLGDKIKSKIDHYDEIARREKEQEKKEREFRPHSSHGEGLLDDSGDFFEKADQFARGDYDAVQKGKITIEGKLDQVEKPAKGPVKGFEDLDGDGDEIIDDAIIEE